MSQSQNGFGPGDSRDNAAFVCHRCDSIQAPIQRELVMSHPPPCPKCASSYAYEDRNLLICPECAHEWSGEASTDATQGVEAVVDANGNLLQDGDIVSVIKDLKVKGSSSVVKVGTRVKNIRLVEGDHNIDCKIDGIGAMKLKSEFVKKVKR